MFFITPTIVEKEAELKTQVSLLKREEEMVKFVISHQTYFTTAPETQAEVKRLEEEVNRLTSEVGLLLVNNTDTGELFLDAASSDDEVDQETEGVPARVTKADVQKILTSLSQRSVV